MERVTAAGMRRCLKLRAPGNCMTTKSIWSRECLASSICSSRSLSSSSKTRMTRQASIITCPQSSYKLRTQISYSTTSSSPEGTIGAGEAGIPSEVSRKEALVAPPHLDEKERQIWDMLMDKLECRELDVQDISGGCGSMYGINIVSEKFRGLGMLKQQRLVNEVLGEEIKKWHGVQLKTRAP